MTFTHEIHNLSNSIESKKDKLNSLAMEIQALEKQKAQLVKQQKSEAMAEPKVSDHALLRYLERVLGLNIEEYKEKILTSTLKSAIAMGAKKYKTPEAEFVIQGNTVVTVL